MSYLTCGSRSNELILILTVTALISDINVEMSDSDSIDSGSNKELLISIVGGAVGGAINIIIFVILITALLIIIRHRTRQKLKPNIDATSSKSNNIITILMQAISESLKRPLSQ